MKVQAEGQLAHHFWGTYHCTIGLAFRSESEAVAALSSNTLGQGWQRSKRNPDVLRWHGPSPDCDAIFDRLESLGADRRKIDSLTKSVDLGEPFTVEFEALDPNQLSLLGGVA